MITIRAIDMNSDENYRLQYHPLSADTLLPMYSSVCTNLHPLKAESDLTYTLPVSRKRSRDFAPNVNWNPVDRCASFTFLGEDISSQIRQQQFEIDQFVARQTEKIRTEIEERRKRHSIKLIAALEEGIKHRLIAKEEEITKMTKLNYALEDKVQSLCIDNQIWRELAQTNEATANALRSNLKQVLEQVVHNTTVCDDAAAVAVAVAVADDAESCCEGNNGNERRLAEQDSGNSSMKRLCRRCGEAESCVLLLPCRHLCLCTVCGSSVDICPICESTKKISVHVHMS